MKDLIRVLKLLIFAIFIVIVVYPFLHEIGHVIASLLVGAKICELTIFPMPSVLCNMSGVGRYGIILVGVGGIVFPFIFSILLFSKHFWLWGFGAVMNFMCTICFLLSDFYSLLFLMNNPIVDEDITRILEWCPEYAYIFAPILLALSIISSFLLIFSNPKKHIFEYFDVL